MKSVVDEKKVSIIMPVFNAEDYLQRSISSVKNQKYQEWELIIVDDGSSDHSLDIINKYCKEDSRIELIKESHGGASKARNAGLRIATGEYIAFLDADDAYHSDFLYDIINAMEKNRAEIGICRFSRGNDETIFLAENPTPVFEERTSSEILWELYNGGWSYIISPCAKVYDANLYEKYKISFPDGMCFEDVATMFLPIYYAKSLVETETPLYFYNVTPNSASDTKRSVELLDREKALRKHWEFYREKGHNELMLMAMSFYLKELIIIYYRIIKSDRPQDGRIIINQFRRVYRRYRHQLSFSASEKEQIHEFLNPNIYGIYNKIKKDGVINTVKKFIHKRIGTNVF